MECWNEYPSTEVAKLQQEIAALKLLNGLRGENVESVATPKATPKITTVTNADGSITLVKAGMASKANLTDSEIRERGVALANASLSKNPKLRSIDIKGIFRVGEVYVGKDGQEHTSKSNGVRCRVEYRNGNFYMKNLII